jgi:hypothetical protein
MIKKIMMSLILVALVAGVGWSDVPAMINFQGKLTSSAGTPLTGSQNLSFQVFDVVSGGSSLWTGGVSVTPDNNGIFNVILGKDTSNNQGTFSSLLFDKPYWVQITLNSNALLIPRQPLTATPYAMTAKNVYGGTGYFGGKVGIGTSAPPNGKLEISDTATSNNISLKWSLKSEPEVYFAKSYLHVDGTSSNTTYLGFDVKGYTGKGPGALVTPLVLTGAGNVGIGTTVPAYKLDVAGAVNSTSGYYENGVKVGGGWLTSPSGGHIYNSNTGNVGIGTSAPTSRLNLKQTSDDFTGGFQLTRSLTNLNTWGLAQGTDNNFYLGYAANPATAANFAPMLMVQSSGNVGIGTSAPPTDKLEISDKATGTGAIKWSLWSEPDVYFARSYLHVDGTSSNTTYLGFDVKGYNNNTPGALVTPLVLTGAGNVGIGTTKPTATLDVQMNSASPNPFLLKLTNLNPAGSAKMGLSSSDNFLSFYSGIESGFPDFGNSSIIQSMKKLIFVTGQETQIGPKMIINTNGSVGIGTTAPAVAYKLDVAGAVNSTGGFYENGAKVGGGWATSGTNTINTNAGNVGIGTAAPTDKLEISDAAPGLKWSHLESDQYYARAYLNVDSTSSNTTYLGFQVKGYNGSAGAGLLTTPLVLTGAGNVGVGTKVPTDKLEISAVAPGLKWSLVSQPDIYYARSYLHADSTSSNTTYLGFDVKGWNGTADGPVTTPLVLTGAGKVGIGTAAPTDKLEISDAAPGLKWSHTESTQYFARAYLNVDGTSSNTTYLGFQVKGYNGNAGAGPLSNPMVLTGAGNVGIGLTAPTYKLHVNGDVGIAGKATIGSTAVNTAGDMFYVNNGANAFADTLYQAGSSQMYVGQAGNNQPWNDTGNGTGLIQTTGNLALSAGLNATALLIQNGTGNVGIGTKKPNYRLQVTTGSGHGIWGETTDLSKAYAGVVGYGYNGNVGVYGIGSVGGKFDSGLWVASGDLTVSSGSLAVSGGGLTVSSGNPTMTWSLASEPSTYWARANLSPGGGGTNNANDTFLQFQVRSYPLSGYRTPLVLTAAGNVGINAAPVAGYTLWVAGTAGCTSGLWTGSDLRWKKNITPLKSSLEKVVQLQGVNYEWRMTEFPDRGFTAGTQVGLIAQDVEKVIPELVKTDDKGYKTLAYDKLTSYLVEAVKELKAENDGLKARLKTLEEKSK